MATVKNYKFDNFMYLFNYGVPDIMEPREEEPVSFNIVDGDFVRTYKSSVSEEKIRKLILDKIPHMQISKQMNIIEPDIMYDFDFFQNNILSTFKAEEGRIFLKEINLINREKNVSTYSITADVYPEIYSILKKSFSLENLYYAFVGATDEEKKIILDYLNSLKFILTNNINYNKAIKLTNEEELKFLNLDEMYNKKLKEVLDKATRNSHIIELFNIDNPFFEIALPVGNSYTDDLMLNKKLAEEKEARQLRKKYKNLSEWLNEDIDS